MSEENEEEISDENISGNSISEFNDAFPQGTMILKKSSGQGCEYREYLEIYIDGVKQDPIRTDIMTRDPYIHFSKNSNRANYLNIRAEYEENGDYSYEW